jgi:formylglycine-generating enzyme required for sulfatase activity
VCRRLLGGAWWGLAGFALLAGSASCRRDAEVGPETNELLGTALPALGAGLETTTARLKPGAAPLAADAGVPPLVRVSELEPAAPPDACPPTMVYVHGGEFWMGSLAGRGSREERPRFQTRVSDFCIDTYEVTAASYAQCVSQGQCGEPHAAHGACNYGRREDHPINCVDWRQADAYCRSQGARLPSELEWEYAARGGAKYYAYSWGFESPDARTCWKNTQSCPVGSFAPGAFGVHDLSGNVWEWTSDWYGDYPWPRPEGSMKVLRGGGWSRRLESSFSSTLRNRTQPGSWGSHLGFRCARLAKDAVCPFGEGDEAGTCRHGVLAADCTNPGERFNGQRCAPPGVAGCRSNEDPVAGHGCVPRPGAPDEEETAPVEDPASVGKDAIEEPARVRSPEHDGDCSDKQPRRPSAYLVRGGNRAERNRYGKELRCRSRDNGAGWTSLCCPD